MNATTKPGKLTSKHLATAFGVDILTIGNWRNPTPGSRKTKLPFVETVEGKQKRISFHAADTKAWAKVNGVPFKFSFAEVLVTAASDTKRGPITSTAPSAAKKAKVKASAPVLETKAAPKFENLKQAKAALDKLPRSKTLDGIKQVLPGSVQKSIVKKVKVAAHGPRSALNAA